MEDYDDITQILNLNRTGVISGYRTPGPPLNSFPIPLHLSTESNFLHDTD